jgi:adenylate cyclase
MVTGEARDAGENAIGSLKQSMAERLAALLRRQPDLAASAAEVGLVDRRWLEDPGRHPVRTASSVEVVQRFLERSVERRPSTLAAIGLNAIQLLSWDSEREAVEGVPGEVAIVFTDLEGFTRFTATHGDDAATALLVEHHREIGPIVRSRGGRVVKRLGDGLMLSFPSPESAVLATIELLPSSPEPLRLRAGIHAGEAVVTRDDVIGHVVNVAARVAESAKGGEILATAAVRDAIVDLPGVQFGRARRRSFKGVGESVPVCRVEPA